jgi:hypothetical protein
MSVPVLSEPPAPRGAQKTLTQLREQALTLINSTRDATGIATGWYTGNKHYGTNPWESDLSTDYPPEMCGMGRHEPVPVRLYVTINHDPEGDPKTLAENVSTVWEDHGFTVSTVTPYRTRTDGIRDISIRGDHPDGAIVGLFASDEIINIDASTECSVHPTMTDAYDQIGPPDTDTDTDTEGAP